MPLVIATTTRYTPSMADNTRYILAKTMIRYASDGGIPVVAVDGSPEGSGVPLGLLSAGTRTIVHEERGSTMGAGRRQALTSASVMARPVTVWLEPEKSPLVAFLRMLARPILAGEVDIVVPARSEAAFATYPRLQMFAERCGNEAFRRITGLAVDAWFGPRLMNKTGLRFFLDYDGRYGDRWDSTFVPLVQAYAAGLRILSVEVDYQHPPEQTACEEQDTALGIQKRFDQLQSLVRAITQEAAMLGLPKK